MSPQCKRVPVVLGLLKVVLTEASTCLLAINGTNEQQRNELESEYAEGRNRAIRTSGHRMLIEGEGMRRKTYCVYNQTRETFLSLSVTAADTIFTRLRGFIGRLKLGCDEGIWLVPSRGVHTVGVLVPLDLIYLDENCRVIHLVEHFPTFRIAPLRAQAESVLELPTHTIYSSQTQPGDQLVICGADEMDHRLSHTAMQSDSANSSVSMDR